MAKENENKVINLSEEEKALVETLRNGGIKENPVRATLRKGVKFHLSGVRSRTAEKDGKTSDPFPMFTTIEGYEVSPKYFVSIEDDSQKLENSLEGLVHYALSHRDLGTEFKVTKYKMAEGTFGQDGYKPTECELEIA